MGKLKFIKERADSWRREVEKHFPEAMISGYDSLIQVIENDEKDRHVVAAAIRAGAEVIVTANRRHFPRESLEPWGITAQHPSDFLSNLYNIDRGIVVSKIYECAEDRSLSPEEFLTFLSKTVPAFAETVAGDLGLQIQ